MNLKTLATRLVATVGALLLSAGLMAVPPGDYYQTITSQTGDDLKEELRQIVSGNRGYPTTSLSYNGARDALLNSVDNVGGGQVRMIYTNDTRPTSLWADTINREHLWPQSFGAGVSPKYTDMHHLMLCDESINSSRGNGLFGYVVGGTATPNYTGQPEDQNFREMSTGIWMVSENHRGDVARAILFMDTRNSDFSLISRGEELGSNQMGFLDDLLQWHLEDPVDAFEQQRNDRVFAFQNNRNPYIDNPNFVSLVYGSASSDGPSLNNLTLTPTQPDDASTVSFSVDATDGDGVSVVELHYRLGTSGSFTVVNMPLSAGSTYTATNAVSAQSEGTVVQYFIRAEDTNSDQNFLPISGSLNPLSFTVVGDNPVLNLLVTDPSSILEGDTVHILVNATDDDGNSAANLTLTAYWRLAGEASYTPINMSVLSGTTWQTDTPVPMQLGDTTVEYYVEAVDAGTGQSFRPAGGASTPASYFVEIPSPFTTITSAAQAAGKLMITEVAEFTVDAFTEFVEIANVSNEDFSLEGLMISDNGVGGTTEGYVKFPAGSTIEAGGILVVFFRDTPSQAFVDTIPVLSNRNGAAVQVFAIDNSITFNGSPVVAMEAGMGAGPELSTNDNIALVYIDPTDADMSEEAYEAADVIDGVGWGNIGSAFPIVAWGPGVTTDGSSMFNASLSNRGIFRTSPIDTDTKDDWMGNAAPPNDFTPGELPASFEIPDIEINLSGDEYAAGTPNLLSIEEGESESLSISLASAPVGNVSVSIVRVGGTDRAEDFQVTAGATLTFTAANFATAQTITIIKVMDLNMVDDEAFFQVSGDGLETLSFTAREADSTTAVDNWITY